MFGFSVAVGDVVIDDEASATEVGDNEVSVCESTPLLALVDPSLSPNVSSEQPRVATKMLVAIALNFSMT